MLVPENEILRRTHPHTYPAEHQKKMADEEKEKAEKLAAAKKRVSREHARVTHFTSAKLTRLAVRTVEEGAAEEGQESRR